MYRKGIFILCLLLVLMMGGCGNMSTEEENIKGFLIELYQVENTDEYQELIAKVEEYFKDNGNDVKDMSIIVGDEIYKPFILKYERYFTEVALQEFIANGYITKHYQQAWEEECQFSVKEVVIEQNQKENQIYYTIKVEKRLNNSTTQLKEGKGIIRLNENGYVDWFKIINDL